MGVNNTLILHKRNSYIPHSQLFLIAEKLKNKNFEVGTISAYVCMIKNPLIQ